MMVLRGGHDFLSIFFFEGWGLWKIFPKVTQGIRAAIKKF